MIIRAKSNTFKKRKEQSLKMEKDRFTLVRNTNALCGVENVAKIGVFERSLSKQDEANYKLVKEFYKRLKVRNKNEINFKEHDLRYFIGSYDITKDKGKKIAIKNILQESCNIKKWNEKETVKAWISDHNGDLLLNIKANGTQEKINKIPLALSECLKIGKMKEKRAQIYDCPIKSYGFVRLISPK